MIKHVIKILLAVYCFQSITLSQDIRLPPVNEGSVNSGPLLKKDNNSQKKNADQDEDKVIQSVELYRYSFDLLQKTRIVKEENTFNIVSSFRQNIRFGGFWDRYAIVNFTPDMFIKPFDFISIYAVHNTSYFIPIIAVKEHFRLMAIQSMAILAIDNTIKFLLPAGKMIKSIAGFVLKNIVINSLLQDI